jgi:hypothetical protein
MMPEHHDCASSAPGAGTDRRVARSRKGVILNTRKRGGPGDPSWKRPTPLHTANREQVMNILSDLNDEGATIVVVGHSPSHGDGAKRRIEMAGRVLASAKRDLRRVG